MAQEYRVAKKLGEKHHIAKLMKINKAYLKDQLIHILNIPSPTGYTDAIVHYIGNELERLGVDFELTRRGAIRANLSGELKSPDRAVVAHLDTIGGMVNSLKDNGRLGISPIGTWSSRFAEGARVTIFTDQTSKRGSILPLKASGHSYNLEVDQQPIAWDNIEIRVDECCNSALELSELGFNVGDFVAIDPGVEDIETGFLVSRHIDGKGGVATLLATMKAVRDYKIKLPVACHMLFTIAEEVGSGASAVLHQDVAEMVTLDMAALSPKQNSSEYGVSVIMKDASGPFEYHLTHKLLELCRENNLVHTRDVIDFYYCDSASAIEAGCDIRTALIGYGVDASHGYERMHMESLEQVAELVLHYIQSKPLFKRDEEELGPLEGFSTQPD